MGAGAGPIQRLRAGVAAAAGPQALAEAQIALARALQAAMRGEEAQTLLDSVMTADVRPRTRATAALDLGLLHLAGRRETAALAAWQRVAELAPEEKVLVAIASLHAIRIPGEASAALRLARLQRVAEELAGATTPSVEQAANVADLARQIGLQAAGSGDPVTAASARALALSEALRGVALAEASGDATPLAQALDLLSGEQEQQGAHPAALQSALRGVWVAQRTGRRELLYPLEHRVGRLSLATGDPARALAAFRRAVRHVEAVRSDIPVQYEDGRSSFRETLEPLFLALADRLLQDSDHAQGAARQALLREARDAVELIKQSELEDYLQDRCALGALRKAGASTIAPGTAVVHPVILPDRLALIIETAAGLDHAWAPVEATRLRQTADTFVAGLRETASVRQTAEVLYRWLVAPLEPVLQAQGIATLLLVPDGVLRLVPLASLHDGRGWLVERFAIATLPALGLMPEVAPRRPWRMLRAGVADPGPAADRLPAALVAALGVAVVPGAATGQAARDRLRASLALPGVREEMDSIARAMPGTTLLNADFTLQAFRRELLGGDYPIVHIASHGVFGATAQGTFVMAWDELLTLEELQALLAAERFRRSPIELLTLSACQTAEGDDRAPLGMSGTAIRARARSALGSLWPVSDEAAGELMTRFYALLVEGQATKAQALRLAQLELMRRPGMEHPTFWAPFSLVGDWR